MECAKSALLLVPFVPAVQAAASFSWYSQQQQRNNNMNSITERDGSGTITMTPRNEADQSALLVICHGLGDTSDGFDDVAEVSTCCVCVDGTRSMGSIIHWNH